MKLELIPVQPISQHTSPAFVDYADRPGEVRDMTILQYPRSEAGEALRSFMKSREITIRQASSQLQIKPSELSGLQYGSFTLSLKNWADLFEELRKCCDVNTDHTKKRLLI